MKARDVPSNLFDGMVPWKATGVPSSAASEKATLKSIVAAAVLVSIPDWKSHTCLTLASVGKRHRRYVDHCVFEAGGVAKNRGGFFFPGAPFPAGRDNIGWPSGIVEG